MPSKPLRFGFEAVAAKPFTYSGVKYSKGERFPYKGLGVIDFDLRGLWMAELIEFGDKPYAPSDAELDAMTAPTAKAKPAQPRR